MKRFFCWLLALAALGSAVSCGSDAVTTYYTVTFNSQGGSAVAAQSIASGALATLPSPAPTNAAFSFGGWYRDQACLTPWKFASDTVTTDVTLYAKWWVGVSGAVLVPEMVSVPAKTGVSIGWAGVAEPVHAVASISAFALGRYEVTYALWTNVVAWAVANGYTFTPGAGVMGDGAGDTPQHPVTTVSHNDALAWCNALSQRSGLAPVYYTTGARTLVYTNATDTTSALVAISTPGNNDCVRTGADGYRLPTEAEWEYAARRRADGGLTDGDKPAGYGGTFTNHGDAATALTEWGPHAWFNGNSGVSTQPVGASAHTNALGVFDMTGNVWEWCWDWYDLYLAATPFTDAGTLGPVSGTARSMRGGSWDDGAYHQRTAVRYGSTPGGRADYVGIRVARTP